MGPTLPSTQPPAPVPTRVPWLSHSQFTGSDSPKRIGEPSATEFWHFPWGKTSWVLKIPGPGANTQHDAFRDGPAGRIGREPPNPKSLKPTKPLTNHPNHQKPSPSLSFRFLLLVLYFLNPTLFSPSHHLAGTSDGAIPTGYSCGIPLGTEGCACCPDLPGARRKSHLAAAAMVPKRGP